MTSPRTKISSGLPRPMGIIGYNFESAPEELITAAELAQKTELPVERIMGLVESGHMPWWQIDGGPYMFELSECRKWIAANLPTHHHPGRPLRLEYEPASQNSVPVALRGIQNLGELTATLHSGIYFLCRDDKIVYIGQSVCLADRIRKHRCDKDFDRIFFFYWPVFDLDRVEGALIRRLRPEYNKTDPGYPHKSDAAALHDIFGRGPIMIWDLPRWARRTGVRRGKPAIVLPFPAARRK